MEPKDVKVALIHEDGPTASALPPPTDVRQASRVTSRAQGGLFGLGARPLGAGDKLKRQGRHHLARRLQLDITLFLRQARERAQVQDAVGAGAGYSQLDKLRTTFGADIDNFRNIDPVPAQLLDPAKLAPVGDSPR